MCLVIVKMTVHVGRRDLWMGLKAMTYIAWWHVRHQRALESAEVAVE